MPRNGSGSYSIPNTYSDGQTISAAIVNANFSDIATELTNSVAKDGQSSLTGPLKASNGTAAAPSVTFASDTDTGMYRKGANNPAITAGGADVVDVTTSGVAVTGTLSATGAASVGGNLTVTGNASMANLTASGTVSLPTGSIETADLADDAVTLAKQASGTANRLQGFDGSGNPSEVTIGAGLSLSGAALSNTASSFLLSTVTVTNEDDLPFTSGISSTYDEYEIHLDGVRPVTDNVTLSIQVSTDGGANYKSSGYSSNILTFNSAISAGSSASIPLANVALSNSSSYGWRGVIRFWPNGSSNRKAVTAGGSYTISTAAGGPAVSHMASSGYWDGGNDAVTAIRIVASSGNVTGTGRLIGIKNS